MKLLILIGIMLCYIIGGFCYLKMSDYDIQKAEYAGKSKGKTYLKLLLTYIGIAVVISGSVFSILLIWRGM